MMSGFGRPLTTQERQIFQPYFARIVLDEARIMDGKVPFWLRRDMCAIVLGTRIYFRPGAYQPGTLRGVELLGHELTHVSQFLHGMRLWDYVWSCRKGYRNSCYERVAYSNGHMIAQDFSASCSSSAGQTA